MSGGGFLLIGTFGSAENYEWVSMMAIACVREIKPIYHIRRWSYMHYSTVSNQTFFCQEYEL